MLLNKFAKVKINSKTVRKHKSPGYDCDNGDIIDVKIEDLSKYSHVNVNLKCDICGEIYSTPYYAYNKIVKDDGSTYCNKCSVEVRKQSFVEKYGVDNPMKVKEFREKAKNTLLENYGVEIPMHNEKILKKFKETSMEKYGTEFPIQNESVRNKVKKINLEKIGVEYPFQSKEIQNKINNGGIHISKQQRYICELYEAEINYNISGFFIDGLIDNYIAFEYDGSGHDLSIKLGLISEEDFLYNERNREKCIVSNGYKLLRIISKTDKTPKDIFLKNILNHAINIFKDFNIVKYNLDDKKYDYEWPVFA